MSQKIVLIRGTTSHQQINLVENDQPYFLQDNELIHFGVKEDPAMEQFVIRKTFSGLDQDDDGAIKFDITPENTINLACKNYWYDIGLQKGTEYYIITPKSLFQIQENITSYEVIQ